LVRARQEVEHIEERLDVELRKESWGTQNRVRRLRVVRWCLIRIARHVVLGSVVKSRCQSVDQSINHHSSRYTYRKSYTLTSQYPAAAACSSTPRQVTCVLGLSSPCGAPLFRRSTGTSASQSQHGCAFLPQNTRSVMAACSPFCFTFSKGTTRSDKRLGNPFRCVVIVCCCCGCCGCCCSTDGGRCVSNLTPGGN
jgi:hypothetical protein